MHLTRTEAVFNLFFQDAYFSYGSGDAGFFLIVDVTGNSDAGQSADDCHHDHQLHQGKSFPAPVRPIFSPARQQNAPDLRLKKLKKNGFQSLYPFVYLDIGINIGN